MVTSSIGTLVLYLASWSLRFLGTSNNTYAETAGRYLMSGPIFGHLGKFVIGALAQMVVGAALGYALFWPLRLSGTDYWLLKAIGYGALAWYFGIGLLPDMARIFHPPTSYPLTHVILFAMAWIWAVVTTYLMVRYGKEAIESDHLQ